MTTRGLINHATLYIVINSALAIVWATMGAGYPWFAWPLLVWGLVLGVHALYYATRASLHRMPRYH